MVENFVKQYHETGDKNYLKLHYASDTYQRIYAKPKRKWLEKFRVIQEVMSPKQGESVLDVGCAAKMFQPFVEDLKVRYVSVDIAEGFEPDYLCDAETLAGVPSDDFDWVLLSDILEHLPDPLSALRAARRVGRKVFSVVPNWYRLERLSWLPRHTNDRHITRMSPRGWLGLHESADWRVVHMRGFYYVPSIAFYPLLPLRAFDRLMRNSLTTRLSRVVDQRWADKPVLRMIGQELMIVGEREEL